ncbi:MAG: hypothetical protein WCA19_04235 [Candidatus Acidiferrales bacterium]
MVVFPHTERYDRIPDGFTGHPERKIDIETFANYEEAAGNWMLGGIREYMEWRPDLAQPLML